MKTYHLFLIIMVLMLLVLPSTVSAAKFYLNSTNSDLAGASDWNKTLREQTTAVSTIAATILRSSTRTQYAWTNTTNPNNTAWETGGFNVSINVTALGSTSYLWLNTQVDHVYANGTVIESSATSTEQQMSSTGVKTFVIASKDWTDGASTDRLRLRYLMRNSRSNADYAFTISQGDVNSFVNGSITTNYRPPPPVTNFTSNVTSGTAPTSVQLNDTSTNTPTSWNWSYNNTTGNSTTIWFSTLEDPVVTFGVGNWSIKLNATNAGGSDVSDQVWYINVSAAATPAPVASFSQNVTSGTVSTSVQFNDTSTGSPTGWAWYFGDENYTQSWVQQSATAGWTGRESQTAVTLPDGSIVLMGGQNSSGYLNDTWRSTDEGASWILQNASSGWVGRKSFGAVSLFDGSIIIIGGRGNSNWRNDTWLSTDKGVTWVQQSATAGWTTRYELSSVALLDGSIVLMGGHDDSATTYKNDTWRSTDKGVTWVQQSATAGWTGRGGQTAVTLPDDSIVLMGGGAFKNDTWRSTDKGVTWVQQSATAGWTGRVESSSIAMKDNSIVLMGGYDSLSSYKNDTWRSTDKGVSWTLLNASSGWLKREYFSVVALPDGSIVLIGGYESGGNRMNDTWRMQPVGSNSQNPVHTYTSAGNYSIVLLASNAGGYNQTVPTTHYVNVTAAGTNVVASFSQNVTSGSPPTDVSFTDTSTGSPTKWAWYFGDENWTTDPWTLVNASSGWTKRSAGAVVSLPDGSVLMMGGASAGGSPAYNDTWRSTNNGTSWTRVNQSGGWKSRYGLRAVTMTDGSVIITGGVNDGTTVYFNDTWRSTNNGTSWTQVNTSGGWSARYFHGSVALSDGSIVVMGGGGPGGFTNDVWRSTNNGTSWTQVNASAGWTARDAFGAVSLSDNSIVIMGGDTDSPRNNTWRSTDTGTTWTQVNTSGGWSARFQFASVAMPDDSIILMGGGSSSTYIRDAWRSTNKGTSWTQFNTTIGTDGVGYKYCSAAVTTDGSVILTNLYYDSTGDTNVTYVFNPRGSTTQSPTHSYSSVGNYSITLLASSASSYDSTTPFTHYVNVTSGAVTPPVASFTSNATSGTAPTNIQFNDTSSNTPTSWNWSYTGLNHLEPNAANGTEDGTYINNFEIVNGCTLSSSTEQAWQGSRSLKVITANASTNERWRTEYVVVDPSTTYIGSAYLRGNGTVYLGMVEGYANGTEIDMNDTGPVITLNNTWTRYTVIMPFTSNGKRAALAIGTNTKENATYYVDGMQLENGVTPTTWQLPAAANPTYFSTSEDPVYTFAQAGNFTVILTATNAGGSNTTGGTYWINISSGVTAPVASFTVDHTLVRIPQVVTVTDTSTNTPTSWQWAWGDGSANSTFQNGVHQYAKRGNWNIIMTATNAGGSGTSGSTTIRVIGFQND
jgi:PKD repeat protein